MIVLISISQFFKRKKEKKNQILELLTVYPDSLGIFLDYQKVRSRAAQIVWYGGPNLSPLL